MKNKRGKLITVLFVAAMSVSLFTGCSDDATITGLDEGALPELASDTRTVTDELIESDSISNFSLLAATEYSDAELKERIRSGWWKQYYDYTLPMAIFACFGVLALIVALMLKAEDKKKGYGLQEANIKK